MTTSSTRAIIIKEQRAEEVKHHLMVLWADFFTKDHFEQFPNLHQLFWDGGPRSRRRQEVDSTSPSPRSCSRPSTRSPTSSGRPTKAKDMGVYPPA